ncbi:MAG: glycosyltransferase family 1 protein [Acidobacteria bacterium]|nr:MAG: glycosyltransferase family 1 protein [Acidobacteriota bacterium]
MRIAVVTDNLSLSRGGSECYLLSLVARLIAAGHEIHTFYNRGFDQIEGGKYYAIRPARYPRFLREWDFCRQVDRQVRLLEPDAVLTVRPLASATHYRLSNGVHVRCFGAEREAFDSPLRRMFYRTGSRLNPKRQLLVRAQRRLLTRVRRPRLMVNSRMARDQLRHAFGMDPQEVTLLYSGVDLDTFRPAESGARGKEPLRLLFVGHHFFLKGLHCLMAALASEECAGLDLSLQVVGSGPITHFRRLAAKLGVSSRVSFLGSVPRAGMPDLYRSHSVLVHPSFYDPCSLASLEAMACGCPVITTEQNGACELIESGRNGWVVRHPRDIAALAGAIRKAFVPGVAREVGLEAAATARERLDLRCHVQAVTRWLEA